MTAHRSTRRAAIAVTAAATAALVLAGCGGEDTASDAQGSAGRHNSTDVAFAQGMIPHHRQAVRMARLAATQASSRDVKDLSEAIEKAQGPEIEKMSGWLRAWDEKVPPKSSPGMEHDGHSGDSARSGGSMPGTMTPEDMGKLKKMSGKDFDSAFLKMMIEHHEGAVTMAGKEKAKGDYAPATSMARDIAASQTAEIEKMRKLLGD